MPLFVLNYMKELKKNNEALFVQACKMILAQLLKKPVGDVAFSLQKLFNINDQTPKFIQTLAPFRQAFLNAKHPISPVAQLENSSMPFIERIARENESLKRYIRAMCDFAFKEMLADDKEISAEILELMGLKDAMVKLTPDERKAVRDSFLTSFVTEYLSRHVEKMCQTNPAYADEIVNLFRKDQLTAELFSSFNTQLIDAKGTDEEVKIKKYLCDLITNKRFPNGEFARITKLAAHQVPGALVEYIVSLDGRVTDDDNDETVPKKKKGFFSGFGTKSRPAPVAVKQLVAASFAELFRARQDQALLCAHSFVLNVFKQGLPAIFAEVSADFTTHGKQLVQDFHNVDFIEYLLNDDQGAREMLNDKPIVPPVIKQPVSVPAIVLQMQKEMGEKPEVVAEEIPKKQPFQQDVLLELDKYFHSLVLKNGKVAEEKEAPEELTIFIKKIIFLAYAEILTEEGDLKESIALAFAGKSREEILAAYLRKLFITVVNRWLADEKAQAELEKESINADALTHMIEEIQSLLALGLSPKLLISLQGFPLFGRNDLAGKFAIPLRIKSTVDVLHEAASRIQTIYKTCEEVTEFVASRRKTLTRLDDKKNKAETAIRSCQLIINEAKGIGEGQEVLQKLLSEIDKFHDHLIYAWDGFKLLEKNVAELKLQAISISQGEFNLRLNQMSFSAGKIAAAAKNGITGTSPHQLGLSLATELGLFKPATFLAESKDSGAMNYARTEFSVTTASLKDLIDPALSELDSMFGELNHTLVDTKANLKILPAGQNPFDTQEKDDGEDYVVIDNFQPHLVEDAPASELEKRLNEITALCNEASARLDAFDTSNNFQAYLAEQKSDLTQEVENAFYLYTKIQNDVVIKASQPQDKVGAIDKRITAADKTLDGIIETAEKWKTSEARLKRANELSQAALLYLFDMKQSIKTKKEISIENRKFYLDRKNIIMRARLKDFVWDDLSKQAKKISSIEGNMRDQIELLAQEIDVMTKSPMQNIDIEKLEIKIKLHTTELEANKKQLYKAADTIIERVGPVQGEQENATRILDMIYSKILYLLLGFNEFWDDRIGFFGGGTAFLAADNKEHVFPKRATAMMLVAKRQSLGGGKDVPSDLKLQEIAEAFASTKPGWGLGRSSETTKFYEEIARPLLAATKGNLYDTAALHEFDSKIDQYMKTRKNKYNCYEHYLTYARTSKVGYTAELRDFYGIDLSQPEVTLSIGNEDSPSSSNDRRGSFSNVRNS